MAVLLNRSSFSAILGAFGFFGMIVALGSAPLRLLARKTSRSNAKSAARKVALEVETDRPQESPEKKKKKKKSPARKTRRRVHWDLVPVTLLLILMAAQMVHLARVKSATMDEQNHITRGVTYVLTGDLRLGRVHPPLINLISGLPFLFSRDFTLPLDHSSWQNSVLDEFAREFLWRGRSDVHSIVFRARLPIIGLALLLGLIVYTWARELFGLKAGLLALGLLAFDPNILAHGSLATNDLGLAVFATLSAYTFWRWLNQPTWGRALVATLALGLAQASKFSAVYLIPTLALTALVHWFLTPSDERRVPRLFHLFGWLALIGLAMAVTVWAIYGFKMGQLRGGGSQIPASAYFNELRAILARIDKGNPSFLLGSYSTEGWWYYFPVAFAVKTPLPTLILIGGSLVFAWRSKALRKCLPLLIPVAVYFAGSMLITLNIGYRHLLPVLPLLFILIGQLAQIRWNTKSIGAYAVSVLFVWLAIGTWSVFPDYLAYFNEAAGGPEGGKRILVDSNLDWGQDLIGLREYMEREGIDKVKLGYFGSAYPESYGINYEPLPGFIRYWWPQDSYPAALLNPTPGVYAISVTNLQGVLFPNRQLYSQFISRKPEAMIGHSIYIYRLK